MRSLIVVAAATMSTVLLAVPAVAQQRAGGRPSLGARALTDRVLALTRQVESLEASNVALGEAVQALSSQVARLLSENAALGSMLACVAPDSGPGRFVLRGCDLAVERFADGSELHGNVEIEGVLSLNEVAARIEEADPRSGTLRLDAPRAVVLASPDRLVLTTGSSEQVLSGDGDVTLDGSRDVRVRASSRIVLQAPVLVMP